MLSDLLQFIDHRHKLLKYFDKISKSNIRELNKVRESFIMLVGGSRVALLCGNIKELSFFCSAPFSSYALMYSDYFQNKSEIGKWRSKMMLEF
uniref:Uncharacterized protein n=1 Tax=Globodera pallida TaxID=36090 RepID=A0A183CRC6_GLOPA